MTIEAAAQAGVFGLLGHMAFRARQRIERWRLVRVMAILTRLIRMGTDGMHRALLLLVALHAWRARPRRSAKAMAVLTTRPLAARMQGRDDAVVALLAQFLGRRRKTGAAVAFLAGDLADVRGVPRAVLDHVVIGGNLLGRRW